MGWMSRKPNPNEPPPAPPDERYPHITCLRCGRTSYNSNDIEEGYCGNCHVYLPQQDYVIGGLA